MSNKIINETKINEINSKLLNWFDNNKRPLIFRKEKDPYKIWISEIMAQQTQINTLIPYFSRFIEAYPTIQDLSAAQEEDVLHLWEGLGYYSRAKNLLKAAKTLKGNNLPNSYKELLKLPGIGEYTAGAIASIAFRERVPAIDGNVIRVISRLFAVEKDLTTPKNKKQLWLELQKVIPDEAGNYNESLMELGALICTPKKPSCLICPVRIECEALKKGKTLELPIKKKKSKKEVIENEALIILNKNGEPLYQKRINESLLNNMYGFPLSKVNSITKENLLEYADILDVNSLKRLGVSKHIFTHKVWNTTVFSIKLKGELLNFTNSPSSVPKAFKKMLELLY